MSETSRFDAAQQMPVTKITRKRRSPSSAVTRPHGNVSVGDMSDVGTQTETEKKFDAEAFAMNVARAMESSGQALAAYLKPRESGDVKAKPPAEVAEVIGRARAAL